MPQSALAPTPEPPSPEPLRHNPLLGVSLKLVSIACFTVMAVSVKLSENVPVGQLVWGRAFFALIPIILFLMVRGELATGLKTKKPMAHLGRSMLMATGMGFGFFSLTTLPLPEANAIGFSGPLFVVVLSAIILKEDVRWFRWTAVLVGFAGVLFMISPRFSLIGSGELGSAQLYGALAGLMGTLVGAFAGIVVREMTRTERSATIVFYSTLFTALVSLVSLFWGWVWPSPRDGLLLVTAGVFGGIGQVFLTESFRHAQLSSIAPFDYTSLLFSLAAGYFIFAELPTWQMLVGAPIVIAAGLFVIWREHARGIDRTKQRKVSLPQH